MIEQQMCLLPSTWEKAMEDVAASLRTFKGCEHMQLDEILERVEELLDELKQDDNPHDCVDQFGQLAWLGTMGYVRERWERPIDFVAACNGTLVDALVLLPKKQHDYGHDNILWGGVQGVVVRAYDKLARIKNLKKRHGSGTGPMLRAAANEPLTDSYFDLIGYGIVGAMLVKGTFQLPLKADLELTQIDTDEIADGDSVLVAIVRAVVRDELAKRGLEADVPKVTAKDYQDILVPLFDGEPVELFNKVQHDEIRHIVRDEMAKREIAKSHG